MDERDEYTRQLDDVMGDIREGGWLEGTDGEGQRWRLDGLTFFRAEFGFDVPGALASHVLPMTWQGPPVHADAEMFELLGMRATAARMRSEAAVRLFHRTPRWYLLKIAMWQAFLSGWYEMTEKETD